MVRDETIKLERRDVFLQHGQCPDGEKNSSFAIVLAKTDSQNYKFYQKYLNSSVRERGEILEQALSQK